jgi:hypothetical protein
MMSKGFPQVPESILLEPDDVITYTEEESYNYEHEKNEEGGGRESEEDVAEGGGDRNVRGVLTKRLWNYILARCAVPPDMKYVDWSAIAIFRLLLLIIRGISVNSPDHPLSAVL